MTTSERDRPALEIAAESPTAPHTEKRLHRQLSSFGALLLTLSCLSPVFSVYGVGADVLHQAGSGAVLLFLLAIPAAVVWAVVYAELGSAYPYAGGDYVGVGSILGPWAGIVTLAMWVVTTGPAVAFEAKIISTYVNELGLDLPDAAVTYGGLALAVMVSLLAVRTGAWVTGLFLAVETVAVLLLIGSGFWHRVRGLDAVLTHPVAVATTGTSITPSLVILALAWVSTVYGTVGGNQAIYFGEELGDPHRRLGRVIIIACLIGAVATALPVIAVVLGAPDLAAVLMSPAPFSIFMTEVAGSWTARALSAGVALAIFNAMIVQIMANARLFYSMGRDALFFGRANRSLAQIDRRSGVPQVATLAVGAFSAACCLLGSHTLLILLTGLLVYAWSLVCLAVLVGRVKGLTGGPGYWRAPFHPLAPVLGLVMALVFAATDLADPDAGRPSLIVLGVVVIGSLLWNRFVLQRRPGGWRPVLGGG